MGAKTATGEFHHQSVRIWYGLRDKNEKARVTHIAGCPHENYRGTLQTRELNDILLRGDAVAIYGKAAAK